MTVSEHEDGPWRPRRDLVQPFLRGRSTRPPDGVVVSFRYHLARAQVRLFRDADYETGHGWDEVAHQLVAYLEDEEGESFVESRMRVFVCLYIESMRILLWAHDSESRGALLQLLDDDAVSHEADRIQGWWSDES